MSDEAVLGRLSFSQGERFYYYRWSGEPPFPPHEIVSSSANMHLIPTTRTIEKKLSQLRPGHIVKPTGYLVEANGEHGFMWRSSLSRDDSGNGACELIWVEDLEVR